MTEVTQSLQMWLGNQLINVSYFGNKNANIIQNIVRSTLNIDWLIIGGGGAGGLDTSGGGGAGGYISGSLILPYGNTFTTVVGDGGLAMKNGNNSYLSSSLFYSQSFGQSV